MLEFVEFYRCLKEPSMMLVAGFCGYQLRLQGTLHPKERWKGPASELVRCPWFWSR